MTACQPVAEETAVIRVGMSQLPMSVDPRFATDAASHRVQAFLHRGLIRLNESFTPQADIAASWLHPKANVWEFKLRHDVFFHDGSAVRAQDVAATLHGILDQTLASPLRAGFSMLETIEVLADDHIRFKLKEPDASFLTRLSVGILPEALASLKHSPRHIVGCGDYRLLSWQGHRIEIQPIDSSKPLIRFLGVKDPVTRSLKLVRGELDFTQGDLPPHLLPYLRKQQGITIQHRASTTFSYIGMNLQDSILKDVRVRKALALGLDRNKLKQALLSGLPILAETVLSQSHWASAQLPQTPYDFSQAEVLLDQAGYPRDAQGIRFKLVYRTSTNPTRLRLVTAIADAWQKLGINVSIESLEWGGFYARIKRGDFQVFSLDWVGISDPDIYRWILHSEMWPPKGANRGRYAHPDVDRWLIQATATESVMERQSLYQKVQKQMQEDQVYVPLWYRPVIAVSGPRIKGFKPKSDGSLLGLTQVIIKPLDH
ncbi:MAG: ABC transporter substrate-binding protein [Mariprofundaceae bacterium]